MTRRQALKYLAAAGGATAAAGLGYWLLTKSPAPAPPKTGTTSHSTSGATSGKYGEFLSWLASVSKPYRGQSQNISLELELTPLGLQARDLDFFNSSGISNRYDLKPYALQLQGLSLMTRTQSTAYDAFSVDYQDIGSFKDYILSPTQLADMYRELTYDKINPNDFWGVPWSYLATYPPAPFQGAGATGDTLFIPFDMSTMIQYYRSDLYSQMGLVPATTWNDYALNAKAFLSSKSVFGTVNEVAPDISSIFEFMNFLPSFGANLWDVHGGQITSGLSSSAALAALETYLSLKPFSDPGSLTFTWSDVATNLLHGTGASALQFNSYSPWMDDAARSRVVGKVGYSSNPTGPSGSFSTFAGNGLAVSKFSRHPETAWLWLQWATSVGMQETLLLDAYHSFPSRKTVFGDSGVAVALQGDQYRATRVTKQVWDDGRMATLLPFPKWASVLPSIASSINNAWAGANTPKDALDLALGKIASWGTLTF